MVIKTETLTSTSHHDIFTYLDYIFSCYLHICVCVCVCVCVHACMYICMLIHIFMYICVMCVCVYVCMACGKIFENVGFPKETRQNLPFIQK